MWHVTVRMAWHDRGWDGRVCDNPAANTYCTGSHSLLSERLAREKRTELEKPQARLDSALPDYLPPCFWTSCAFADSLTKTVHRHPFSFLKDDKKIPGKLPAYSVYTWPFRLSITHDSFARHGSYFPDLEERIGRYCDRLRKGRSLVFFYLNYDNPISADDYQYALVGCARLSDLGLTGSFLFAKAELDKLQEKDAMKNFSALNWAVRLTHEGPKQSVRLPYQEYLAHVAAHPDEESKLNEIRVTIDEEALLPDFKYVSEQVNDDHALALLYKLRRAFTAVQRHGIAGGDQELAILDGFIRDAWADRGLYPGLGSAISVLADLAEGEPQPENPIGEEFVAAMTKHVGKKHDLLEATLDLLESKGAVPAGLVAHKQTVRDARAGLSDNLDLLPALRKLSLFALTPRQVGRILFPAKAKPEPFGGRATKLAEVAANPYLLCENYVPATADGKLQKADLDRELATDGPIGYATIDLGMFPDARYLERNNELQDLTVAGPERLRAFAVEALRRNETAGHSFAPVGVLADEARAHPLFFRDSLALRDEQFTSDRHLAHFRQRLHVRVVEGRYYFYLQETKDAEDIVARFVQERLTLRDVKAKLDWLAPYIANEAGEIAAKIKGFETPAFKAERQRLMEGALQRRIYCITGRPGAGKTQALNALLEYFDRSGETTTVLAPTGKAALRLNGGAQPGAKWQAETLARWVFRSGLGGYADGEHSLSGMGKAERFQPADNVVIDETSMVDLHDLALVFRALEVHQPGGPKRVILVGDENQLPPIGCGKPFHDIITFLRADPAKEAANLVRLQTNCRQQYDPVVLDAAHLFAGKNRYHTELYDRLLAGGKISEFLNVEYWADVTELQRFVKKEIDAVLVENVDQKDRPTPEVAFNRLLRLYDNGFVPKNDAQSLALDRVQFLTPYRGGPSGSLGLSQFIRNQYRADAWLARKGKDTAFAHSDKLIRISNYYGWNSTTKQKELRLSNGSIGVLNNNAAGRQAFFPENKWPQKWDAMKEEDFELAYGVTVHKAQGSEFQEVIVVLPERRALLSRELVYTALTRSKTKLTLLIQKGPRPNPLKYARQRSVLLFRNSSTFAEPFDSRHAFEPEPGVRVQSKIEFMIYKELQRARDAGQLTFAYEEPMELPLGGRTVQVHPDFTIRAGGKTFYWEHLGMLDRADYSRNWRDRRAGYGAKKILGSLVTTDDLGGVRQERLSQVVADLTAGNPGGEGGSEFSLHHYCL